MLYGLKLREKEGVKVEIHYWEKQLILYTKGHFKRIDYKKDIKLFPAKLYGLGVDQVDMKNVLHMVVDIYDTLCKNKYIDFNLKTFIHSLLRESAFKGTSHKTNVDDILNMLLAEIQNIPVVSKGLDLGKADGELLEKIQLESGELQ